MTESEPEKRKRSLHQANSRGAKSKSRATRSTRKAVTKRKGNYKAGPGRPKGSVKDATGLTPNQKAIANVILDAELANGLYPASVKELVEITGKDPSKIRALLKKKEFQDYLADQLKAEGVVLEGAFWRGMQLGLQAADPKILDLYAKMTGKIVKQEEKKVEITVKGISDDSEQKSIGTGLPHYESDGVQEAEIVDD